MKLRNLIFAVFFATVAAVVIVCGVDAWVFDMPRPEWLRRLGYVIIGILLLAFIIREVGTLDAISAAMHPHDGMPDFGDTHTSLGDLGYEAATPRVTEPMRKAGEGYSVFRDRHMAWGKLREASWPIDGADYHGPLEPMHHRPRV